MSRSTMSTRASSRGSQSARTYKRGRLLVRFFRLHLMTPIRMLCASLKSSMRYPERGSERRRALYRLRAVKERRSTSWLPEWRRSSSPRRRGGTSRRHRQRSTCRQTFGVASRAPCGFSNPSRWPGQNCRAVGPRLGSSSVHGLGCSSSIATKSRPIGSPSSRCTTHDQRCQLRQVEPEDLVPTPPSSPSDSLLGTLLASV